MKDSLSKPNEQLIIQRVTIIFQIQTWLSLSYAPTAAIKFPSTKLSISPYGLAQDGKGLGDLRFDSMKQKMITRKKSNKKGAFCFRDQSGLYLN